MLGRFVHVRVYCDYIFVFSNTRMSFASERGADWPELVPLFELAINDSASTLSFGYTLIYADRGQHPRRPLLLTAPPDGAAAAGGGEAAARILRT
jgi:hypothetical protein